ncbi:MAG: cytochrome C biogenesis protein [Chloroflexi bacterium]|nr:MAG: cytochrome C biogenesis protein [Chloroflexota bacterium]
MGRTALRVRGCVLSVGPYHRSSGYRLMETTLPRGTPMLRIRPWLGIAAAASFVVASVMALFWAPTDAVQGDVYRILYVHVPLAWLAYLAFVIVFLASVGWLWTKRPVFDAIAVASAEIGVLFTGLFLVAGSFWAKPTWGVWWTWEPRLVTTAIMFIMYVGYLLLRGLSTDFSRRATRAAVFGIIAVIDVPIVHLSVLWANSLHQLPTVLRAAGAPALDASMLLTLMVSLGAYTLIYAYLMTARVSLELGRQERLWTT